MAEDPIRGDRARQGMGPAIWAAMDPDRLAVVCEHGDRTRRELNERANQVVRALRRRGLGVGDSVALMSRNRAEWVEVYAGCLRAGWRVTPVNWHLTAEEAAYIVEDCEAKALVVDATLPAAAALVASTSARQVLAAGGGLPGADDYAAVVESEDGSDIDDPAAGHSMLYTSGTTGRPKGVARERPRRTRPVDDRQRRDDDVYLVTGPMYHGGPLAVTLHPPLFLGAPMVVMDGWDAEETLRLIERHRVTHTHMVPTMFHRLLALPEEVRDGYDLSSLRAVWHGAAPCPVHVKQRMIEWFGPVIHEYYSATEGFACSVDSETWLEHPGTVGRPQPEGQVVVGDEEANPLPAGEVGLLWIRAPERYRFQYLGDREKTGRTYRGDHFTLGDMGYMDDDGWLYLTDRSAELIISGGVNIYPAEIDAALLRHPAVADAATIGVPDEEWGESVLAVVQLKDGEHLTVDELRSFCREHLAGYKVPRLVDFVHELPRTDAGKVYKRRLRDEYRARHTAPAS